MIDLNNKTLISIAEAHRDESKAFEAFTVLLDRLKRCRANNGVSLRGEKSPALKDLIVLCRRCSRESSVIMFIDALHKNSLITAKDMAYVVVYACTEKVSMHAFDLLKETQDSSIQHLHYLCKFTPIKRKKLRSIIQLCLIEHKDANENDFRYVAEHGDTKGLAIKAAALLLGQNTSTKTSIERLYRASHHPFVKKMARLYRE